MIFHFRMAVSFALIALHASQMSLPMGMLTMIKPLWHQNLKLCIPATNDVARQSLLKQLQQTQLSLAWQTVLDHHGSHSLEERTKAVHPRRDTLLDNQMYLIFRNLCEKNLDPNIPLLTPVGKSGRRANGSDVFGIDSVNEFDIFLDDIYDYCEKKMCEWV